MIVFFRRALGQYISCGKKAARVAAHEERVGKKGKSVRVSVGGR